MNHIGTPPPCIPIDVAAIATLTTRAALINLLNLAGFPPFFVGWNKLATTSAALTAVLPPVVVEIINPVVDGRANDLDSW